MMNWPSCRSCAAKSPKPFAPARRCIAGSQRQPTPALRHPALRHKVTTRRSQNFQCSSKLLLTLSSFAYCFFENIWLLQVSSQGQYPCASTHSVADGHALEVWSTWLQRP